MFARSLLCAVGRLKLETLCTFFLKHFLALGRLTNVYLLQRIEPCIVTYFYFPLMRNALIPNIVRTLSEVHPNAAEP